MEAKCQILSPHQHLPLVSQSTDIRDKFPPFRHASRREENTGLLIGFLLIKEMCQIRFFFFRGGEFDMYVILY